jgi:pimeloyl-ACP methyl ester carboxylesterase
VLKTKGDAMVMIHGTGSSAALAWSSSVDKLAHYSIYAPDLPAFGRSELPRSVLAATPAEIEDVYADWLANYIDAVGLVKPVVVAHSIGGFFAVKFAKKYPSKVSKLILVDPAGLFPTLGSAGFYFGCLFKFGIPMRQMRRIGRVGSSVVYTLLDNVKASAKAYYWLQLNASPTAFGDQVVAKFITPNKSFFSQCWSRPALRDLLTAGVPFAFVYGETDNLFPPSQGRLVVELSMKKKGFLESEKMVGIVPGAWHMPYHVDKGDPFVDKVLRAVEAASLPEPSTHLLEKLDLLDPFLFCTSCSLSETSHAIERLYAHLRD